MKKGEERYDEGCIFLDMTKERLVSLLYGFLELEIIRLWETKDKKSDIQETIWINVLIKKR